MCARCRSCSTLSRLAPATARDRRGSSWGQLHTGASRQALPEAHTPRLSLPAQHFPVAENWEGARPQVWGLNSPPDQLRVGASE